MRVFRCFTKENQSPYKDIAFQDADSEIRNPDGSIVFSATNIKAPRNWSQVAVDVLAQKYFRKAGIPSVTKAKPEAGIPEWLLPREADKKALSKLPSEERFVGENSATQVFDRMAGAWTYWGWKAGYFDQETDARAFRDELCHMLASQAAAPNSPQWFNTGLHWAYGIDGPPQGHFFVDCTTGAVSYTHLTLPTICSV